MSPTPFIAAQNWNFETRPHLPRAPALHRQIIGVRAEFSLTNNWGQSRIFAYISKNCDLTPIIQLFPLLIADALVKWFSPSGPLASLRDEYERYEFKPTNFVVRHLLAHYLAFQEDKSRNPELFCWPGAWMAGEKLSQCSMDMFEKHGALFVDKEDDDSVFARLQKGREEAIVQKIFNSFYSNAVVYDLANRWIANDGPFRYDLGWLAASASDEEARSYMRRQFELAFGLDPEDVQVLT